ncbi:putative AC9 transposase, partial [Nymphaea thermarum]
VIQAFRSLLKDYNHSSSYYHITLLDCIYIYENEMTKLCNVLEKTNGMISLTFNMWTSSCQKRDYLCLTAHYIDNSWKIKKKVLNFVMVEISHIREKLASDAIVYNEKKNQVRCSIHILNLVVQDGVKEISDVIDKIKENIKNIKASPA